MVVDGLDPLELIDQIITALVFYVLSYGFEGTTYLDSSSIWTVEATSRKLLICFPAYIPIAHFPLQLTNLSFSRTFMHKTGRLILHSSGPHKQNHTLNTKGHNNQNALTTLSWF
ncbi:hypothetical protein ECG_07278 [Echinococcus granulosus]|uniref:Expressed protein n=1 Tax=Echinococcus granulosus TaxID=6210 RepID=A0A068WQ70_ECHGR|nr:hypothetical protein ECG_07278 [Echinococcus granulosus]CDS21947.1 expressed protein [Echinococcus granulosus]